MRDNSEKFKDARNWRKQYLFHQYFKLVLLLFIVDWNDAKHTTTTDCVPISSSETNHFQLNSTFKISCHANISSVQRWRRYSSLSTRNIICCSRKRISIQHVRDKKRFSFSVTHKFLCFGQKGWAKTSTSMLNRNSLIVLVAMERESANHIFKCKNSIKYEHFLFANA